MAIQFHLPNDSTPLCKILLRQISHSRVLIKTTQTTSPLYKVGKKKAKTNFKNQILRDENKHDTSFSKMNLDADCLLQQSWLAGKIVTSCCLFKQLTANFCVPCNKLAYHSRFKPSLFCAATDLVYLPIASSCIRSPVFFFLCTDHLT